MSSNTNGTRRNLPFPWPCTNCLTSTVVPAIIAYTAKIKHDGMIHELHFPALKVPRCPNCGETVITTAIDDRINEAFRARLRLAELVVDYRVNHLPDLREALNRFRGESLEAAISRAARGVDDHCKRFKHQRRIGRNAIQSALNALLAASGALQQCADFDALLVAVEDCLSKIKGVKRLYAYDVALRIGVNLGMLPRRVYLHSGALEGARKLGLNSADSRTIAVDDFPEPLQELEPYQLEDFLCHYKDEFTEKLRRSSNLLGAVEKATVPLT